MKKYYNINYSALVIMLTPIMLRNDMMKALLKSLVKPLELLNNDFNNYIRFLSTRSSAQTCYMQAMLNNRFDSANRRIIVRTASIDYDYYLLWLESQNKSVMTAKEETNGFRPYLLNRDDRIGVNNIDFEIVMPSGLVLDDTELRQLQILVNENKLASKKYRIVYE